MIVKMAAILLVFLVLSGCSVPTQEQAIDSGSQPQGSSQVPPAAQSVQIPQKQAETEPDADVAAKNTALFESLATAGIEDAAVDVQQNLILIAFELPSGMNEEKAAYYAIGAATNLANNDQTIKVEVFNGSASTIYSVDSQTAKKFVSGEISSEEFNSAMRKA